MSFLTIGRILWGSFSTGCITGFSGVEKCMENAMKITNFIGKFCALKSVMKIKLFLLCHSLLLGKFDFYYTIQGTEFANEICNFHSIFHTLLHPRKFCYAPCVWRQTDYTVTK